MAIIEGSNSVFGGQPGAGQAYILPQNQAAGIFIAGIDEMRKQQEFKRLTQLKQQQDLANENSKTLGSFKLADHWGARSAEMQKDFNAINEYAIEATRKGLNLNTDREFLQKRNAIESKAQATNDLQKMYEQNYNEVGRNPDAYENGIQVLESIKNASLDDYIGGKFKPESLKKIYSLADAIKESNGTTAYAKNNDGSYDTTRVNRTGNVGQAIASLSTTPAKYLISKAGGDPNGYLAGFPTVTPEGKTYYNTDGKKFEEAVITTLATDPNFPAYLQQKGYDVSSTDAIRKSAFDYAKKQNKATGNYVKEYADNLENKATTDTTRVFEAERMQLSRQANQRAKESHAVTMQTAADKVLAERPDEIATNVTTNIASMQTNGKSVNRKSTSFAAANVGNLKNSLLPATIFDANTGVAKSNTATVNITGGQVHIKPVLRFGGTVKILDDESLSKLKSGTYKVNGKTIPKNAEVTYDELLYGIETIREPGANKWEPDVTKTNKLIIPITGMSLDGKFDKGYNRVKMYDTAIRAMEDPQDRLRAALQLVKQYNIGKGYSEGELKAQAADYLNKL